MLRLKVVMIRNSPYVWNPTNIHIEAEMNSERRRPDLFTVSGYNTPMLWLLYQFSLLSWIKLHSQNLQAQSMENK